MSPDHARRIAEINRTPGIPADYAVRGGLTLLPKVAEEELVVITVNPEGREVRLAVPTVDAWARLRAAAAADIVLLPHSGFRSVARQAFVFTQPNAAQLAEIAKPADADKHEAIVETILPLSDATRGRELSERGHTRGKIVLRGGLALG